MRAFLTRHARSHLWMNRFVHLSSFFGCAVLICPFARILVFISLTLLWSLWMRSLALNCLWFAFWVSTFVYAALQSAVFYLFWHPSCLPWCAVSCFRSTWGIILSGLRFSAIMYWRDFFLFVAIVSCVLCTAQLVVFRSYSYLLVRSSCVLLCL